MSRFLFFIGLNLLISTIAFATLGEPRSTIAADAKALSGTLSAPVMFPLFLVEEITSDGLSVKEFISQPGVVFAVAWSGSRRPDLNQLLGTHFDEVDHSLKKAKIKKGHGPIAMTGSKVHIEMGGHMRSLSGRAYVVSLLPAGIELDEIHY